MNMGVITMNDPIRFVTDQSLVQQMIQMGLALTDGKDFLSGGKLLPAAGPDAPDHLSGDVIGCAARILNDQRQHLVQTRLMVGDQLLHPFPETAASPVPESARATGYCSTARRDSR